MSAIYAIFRSNIEILIKKILSRLIKINSQYIKPRSQSVTQVPYDLTMAINLAKD